MPVRSAPKKELSKEEQIQRCKILIGWMMKMVMGEDKILVIGAIGNVFDINEDEARRFRNEALDLYKESCQLINDGIAV